MGSSHRNANLLATGEELALSVSASTEPVTQFTRSDPSRPPLSDLREPTFIFQAYFSVRSKSSQNKTDLSRCLSRGLDLGLREPGLQFAKSPRTRSDPCRRLADKAVGNHDRFALIHAWGMLQLSTTCITSAQSRMVSGEVVSSSNKSDKATGLGFFILFSFFMKRVLKL